MRSRSLFGAAVIGAAVALSCAAPVGAVPGVSVEHSQAAVDSVDDTRAGTLVLEFSAPNPYDDEPGPTNVGVGVELRRVAGVDLATNEGWHQAAGIGITELVDADGSRFDRQYTGVTNSNGVVTFTGLPLGLYFVTPLAVDGFEPFAVTLPRTDVSGTSWLYEVTAHPKVGGDVDESPSPTPGPGLDPGHTDSPGSGATSSSGPSPTAGPEPRPSGTLPEGESGSDGDSPAYRDGQGGQTVPGRDATERTDAPSSERSPRTVLAETGASVIGIVLLGLALLLAGFFLARRKPIGNESTTTTETPTYREL